MMRLIPPFVPSIVEGRATATGSGVSTSLDTNGFALCEVLA